MSASWKTADLCDQHGEQVHVVEPLFRDFGGRCTFCGPITTIKAHEDNSLVRTALEEPGQGRVLVVDGGGSLRCAMVGDQLGLLGVKNRWAGIVVWGCIRDAAELAQLQLGIKALAPHPRKSHKRNEGQRDLTVRFAGVTFTPGQHIYADEDGIILAPTPLH